MRRYPEPVTAKSRRTPADRKNNFWYYCGSDDTVFVFLHGIFSDSRGCWLSEEQETKVFWPDLVLEDFRFGMPSIYLAGYFTEVDSGDFSIASCAREVMEALEREDEDGSRPVLSWNRIVFVCHSTGGIVARYLLERNQGAFRHKTVGVALIASPSLGSVWANVAGLAARYYNQRLALQLRCQGESIEDIHGRFRDLVDRSRFVMPGLFGMEACENSMIFRQAIPRCLRWLMPPRWKIVSTRSAGQYFGEVKVLRGTNHFTTVKPTGKNHPSHEFLATFFAKVLAFEAASSRKAEERVALAEIAETVGDVGADRRSGQELEATILECTKEGERTRMLRRVPLANLESEVVKRCPASEIDEIRAAIERLIRSGDLRGHSLDRVNLTTSGRERLRRYRDGEEGNAYVQDL